MSWRPSSSTRPQTEDTRLLRHFNRLLQCKHTWKSSWDIFLLTENPAELKNSLPPGRERSNSPVAYCRVNSSFWKWPPRVITGPLQSMKYSLTIPAEAQKRSAYLRIWSGVRRKQEKKPKKGRGSGERERRRADSHKVFDLRSGWVSLSLRWFLSRSTF